jgi:hypothetical protein
MTENVGLKSESVKSAQRGVEVLTSEKRQLILLNGISPRDLEREESFRAQLEAMDGPVFHAYVSEFINSLPDEQQQLVIGHFSQLAKAYGANKAGFNGELTTFLVEKGMYYQQAAEALVKARQAYNEQVRVSLEGSSPVSQFIGTEFERSAQEPPMLAILLKTGHYKELAKVNESVVRHTIMATNRPQNIATLLDGYRRADGTVDFEAVQQEIATRLPESMKEKPRRLPEYEIAYNILTYHIYVLSGDDVVKEDTERLKLLTDPDRLKGSEMTKKLFLAKLDSRKSLFALSSNGDERDAWKLSAQAAINGVLKSTDPGIISEREQLITNSMRAVNAMTLRRQPHTLERFQEAYTNIEKDLRAVPFKGVDVTEAALVLYFESLSAMVLKNALKQQGVLSQSEKESQKFYEALAAQNGNWQRYFAETVYTAKELEHFDPFKGTRSANCKFTWQQLGWAMSDYYATAEWLTQNNFQSSPVGANVYAN